MKLKKRDITRILLVTAFMLTPAVVAFADSDDSQESEKLYMIGDVETEAPIKVVIDENSIARKAGNNVDSKYAFESDLIKEDPAILFEENSRKVLAALYNLNKRTITINRATYQFLTDFTDSYFDVYITKTMPDFIEYYDLSSNAREENKLLVEASVYREAAAESNNVLSVDSILNITEVTPATGTLA